MRTLNKLSLNANVVFWAGVLYCFTSVILKGQEWNYTIEDIKTFPIHSFQPELVEGTLTVLYMAQDSNGFIWTGTDNGLFRFDGNRFIHFKNDPLDEHSLDDDFVTLIYLDSKDRLLVGTQSGLQRYRPETEDFERIPLFSKSNTSAERFLIRRIQEDKFGRLYSAALGGGVIVIEDELNTFPLSEITQNPINGMDDWRVNRVCYDKSDRLWISTIENGLYRYYPDTGFIESDSRMGGLAGILAGHEVRALYDDGDGNIWLGTHGNGIIKWNEDNSSAIKYNSSERADQFFASESIRNIMEDAYGNIWVGTQDLGLFIYDPMIDSFESISHSGPGTSKLGEGAITSLLVDDRGDLWFSTLFSGAFSIFHLNMHPAGFRYALVENAQGTNLAKNSSLFSYEDSRGDFWIGTDGAGLIRKSGDLVEVFENNIDDSFSLSGNKVTSIREDEKGSLWIGTRGEGLNKFNKESGKFTRIPVGNTPSSIQGKAIWSLFADGDYLWVGSEVGLHLYNTKENKAVDPKELFGPQFRMAKRAVWSITKDGNGRIWIGSLSGLYVGNYVNKGSLPPDGDPWFKRIANMRTQSVYTSFDGTVYVATLENGLFRIDETDSMVRPFASGMNLEVETLHSIGQDLNGDFWATTDSGFVRMDGDTGKSTTFDSRWGFEAQYYWVHNALLGSEGRMYFPSRKGLLFFDPESIGFEEELLVPRITNVEGFDRKSGPEGRKVRFIAGKDPNKNLTFEHDDAVLTFHYSALFFPQPDSVEYQTLLEGIDEHWSKASTRSSASYPLLPPGKYSFKVRARIVGQAWGEPSEALSIQVMSPLYFRWWFVSAILIVLVLSIYFMVQIRLRKIKAQRSVLEATVSKRTDELSKTNVQIVKQKDELEFHKNHLEDLVLSRTSELESAKLKAEESSHLKTAFLANMSHEIRTPLNSIVNFSQLLFDERINDEEREKFKDIVETSSNSLMRLIEEVLDIARLEAGELNIEIESCDIAGLIGRLREIYAGKIRLKNLNLKLMVTIPESYSEKIETDAIRLNQILINLLDNAFKFTDQGEIEFGFVEESDSLKFFVRDSGVGISEANLERIFERFTKIEEDRRKVFPGAGLGLAIAKRLVFLLEGEIWAESEEKNGSVFFFRIPKTVKAVNDKPAELPSIKTSFDWSTYKILVVEDEFSNVEVLRAFLSPTAAKVIYAEDGDQAVECLRKDSSINLILMDLKLPIMDGVTATQSIRTFNTEIPIIAQTAFGVSHERVETLKCGFNDYVTKPLNRDRLLSSIDHYLKRK